jgi:hypothetical protein
MAPDRAIQRKPVTDRLPQAAAPVARGAVAPSAASQLQRRLGNQQTQRWIARAQAASAVSSPHEPAELEAQATARHVMRMSAADVPAAASAGAATNIQRQAASAPAPVTDLRGHASGGQPLPASVHAFMAPRFGTRFDNVRVHADAHAGQLSQSLNAQAFTVANHVYFAPGKFQPDTREGRELIAHELTHTIQQGAVVQRSPASTVTERSPPRVQRLGVGDALERFAGLANNIPGFRMLTVVLGVNPITLSAVERSAVNILRAMIELVPGGALITQALESHGILPRVAGWLESRVRALGMAGQALRQALDRFLSSLSWTDIFDLSGLWERAKRIFTEPIERLIGFAQAVVGEILAFIREAILLPLARMAEGTRGYDLLKAVLGQDPITGQPVARSPENLIGGFMKLIGQEEVWENLKKANAVPRAWAWFQGALAAVSGFVQQIPRLFMSAVASLELSDLILIPRAFARIAGVFGSFAATFVRWAAGAVWTLLEIIFEVVAPAAVPYLAKSKAAFRLIVGNPIGFVRNLIAAIKGGITAFVGNIWTHLKTGFINWLFGALTEAGIEIPEGLPSLPSILKLVANVLGLTMTRLRAEAVKLLGPTAVQVIEKLVAYVQAFWEGGPAALWARIKEDIGNLKALAIDAIQDWLVTTIIKQAVIKLVSLFNPAGAFVQAILAIYNTIQVVIERIGQIAAFVGAIINSVYDIATGAIGGAIKWIENALAGAIPLVLGFLAGLLGIGGLSKKVRETLEKVGNAVLEALRKLIKKGIDLVKKLIGGVKSAAKAVLEWWKKRKRIKAGAETHELYFSGDERSASLMVASDPMLVDQFVEKVRGRTKANHSDKASIDKAIKAISEALRKLKPEMKKPADKQDKTLIVELFEEIGAHLPTLLVLDEDDDREVTAVAVERPKFYARTREQILIDATVEDRRHIVSSEDMATHYEKILIKKKRWEAAKILLERGQPIDKPLTDKKIEAAAKQRHKRFFNDVHNLWPGPSTPNRALGQKVDPKPGMGKKRLTEHIEYIRRRWALDPAKLEVTGIDK